MTSIIISVTLGVASFLCLLNAVFAVIFRRRHLSEVLSYLAAGLIELAIFGFVLAFRLGILTHIPYHLPQHLPFSRAEIGAAIAIAIGLFPAAYWHRSSGSHLRAHIERDAQAMKEQEAAVHVRSNVPGEWMN